MTNTPSHCDGPGASRRIALVGRSGAEAALRAVEHIELLRARTVTDAIGEIALAKEEGHEIETVLLGQGALESDEIAEFEQAMRSLSPQVRTIDIGALDPAAVLERLNQPATKYETFDGAQSSPTPELPAQPATSTPPRRPQSIDRADVTDAILSGVNPTSILLESFRRQTGDPTIRFEETQQDKQQEQATSSGTPVRIAVARRGAHFGELVAHRAAAEELTPMAQELANSLALHAQQRQLHTAAFTDQLTGAWNRRYFDYFVPRTLELARSRRQDVTLMMYDIDDFKSYNDRFGHSAGDNILCETVRLLHSVIRPTDRVCRLGGDEFVVIFDDPTGPRQGNGRHPKAIVQIAARFQKQICEHRFPKLAEQAPGSLTISGGMATFPWDGASASELLEYADALALQSKAQGKNLITLGPGSEQACHKIETDPKAVSDDS